MTVVRIAHAEPQPGMLDNGEFQTLGWLVVLADDAGQRAVPVWLKGEPDRDAQPGTHPRRLTVRVGSSRQEQAEPCGQQASRS